MKRHKKVALRPLMLLACALATGLVGACATSNVVSRFAANDVSFAEAAAPIGASVGGARDFSFARKEIELGKIPPASTIQTEGLFAEHNLQLEGTEPESLFSLNVGSGMVRDADGIPHFMAQIGLDSNLTTETFKRPPLNLVLLVDISKGMDGEALAAARRACHQIIAKLGEDDLVSLMTFDEDVDVEMSSRPVRDADRKSWEKVIESLEVDSYYNDFYHAIQTSYRQIERAEESFKGTSRDKRVVVLTKGVPRSRERNATSDFLSLAERRAAEGVGMTIIGLGGDTFGHELVHSISQVRGANYRYLANPVELTKMIKQDFDFLVTPLAHDFRIRMQAPPGMLVRRVHGVPGWKAGDSMALVEVASVFASRGAGAIAIELEGTPQSGQAKDALMLRVSLEYTSLDGKQHMMAKEASIPKAELASSAYFTHSGVAKTSVLAIAAEAMRRAVDDHIRRVPDATDHLSGVAELIEKVALKTGDSGLLGVSGLVQKLEGNMLGAANRSETPIPGGSYRFPEGQAGEKSSDLPAPPPEGGRRPVRW